MAAQTAAQQGAMVTVYDAMPSVGRKFLVAGKSGLNLTFDEELKSFLSRYSGTDLPTKLWHNIISSFDHSALRNWAHDHGIETFVANSGKVFPKPTQGTIRAAPLLRRWIESLRKQGVEFKTRHRWCGIQTDGQMVFDHSGTTTNTQHTAHILALGGSSWPSTGSNGNWVEILRSHNISIEALTPANCGWETNWPSPILTEAEGLPIKNIRAYAGNSSCTGELVITRYGMEGAPIYRLGPAIRALPKPEITIDFKPDVSHEQLIKRMGNVKRNFIREAKRRWNLDPASSALLKYLPDRGPWTSVEQLAHEVKNCRIPLLRPRPIDEAISSAGGVCWTELDENLMLTKLPGVFLAGEMLNWEAPTGGYLIHACLATGRWTGLAASTFSE